MKLKPFHERTLLDALVRVRNNVKKQTSIESEKVQDSRLSWFRR